MVGRIFRKQLVSNSLYQVKSKFSDWLPHPPSSLCAFTLLRDRGSSLWNKQALYTKRTPCVGEERERGGSLQQDLLLNMTHPNSPPLFSSFPVALCSLCSAPHSKYQKTSLSSHGKVYGRSFPGHINSDKPRVCLVVHSVLSHTLGLTNVETV